MSRLAIVAALTLSCGAAPACSLPVFRVALLDPRWRPEPYEFYLFHRGPLGAPEKEILKGFNDYLDKNEGHVNCVLRVIDLDKNPDKEVVERYEALGARHCVPVYNALDPDTHHPVPGEPRYAADAGGARRARAPLRAHRAARRSPPAFSRERRPRVGSAGIGLKARRGQVQMPSPASCFSG